jgi:hypothetical protein
MRTQSALIGLGLSVIAPSYSLSPQIQALYEDCQDGDRQSCRRLYKLARQACLQGDPFGCQLAENMNGEVKDDSQPQQERPSAEGIDPGSKSNCPSSRTSTQREGSKDCRDKAP